MSLVNATWALSVLNANRQTVSELASVGLRTPATGVSASEPESAVRMISRALARPYDAAETLLANGGSLAAVLDLAARCSATSSQDDGVPVSAVAPTVRCPV